LKENTHALPELESYETNSRGSQFVVEAALGQVFLGVIMFLLANHYCHLSSWMKRWHNRPL